ncbi:relaxase/mobilization nuclease domain-containing protein [Ruminococcus sp.]|uniref:relaxase/mobilization nuclease domain-containing protein n=1 Tax=Ruminococcus sp. TaxID=41978 RepID=UPI0025E6CC8F|nr:relaxase/mobilization nuclease domain-containing protein [Ruminococcus sp.]
MPIIHFINNKTQTAGGMKNVLNYVSRKEKTVSEDKRFVTGVNCSPETALDEMTATKNLYHKTDGRLYYHLVQSFPSGYEIEPELAHKIAVELAEKAFNKYEVVVATHIDREHIHSHLVLNSVSFEDGKKYHSNKESVEELMKLSDEICQRYGVHVLDTPKKKVNKDILSDSEYRSAKRGESFKWELMNVINQVMKQAKSKKQFCYLMKQQGYDVRWEDNRKYITYTVLMARDAVTINFTVTSMERRIWNMSSRQEELQQMYDKELSAAADTQPTVVVLDSNWRALIELNKLMSQEQLEILQTLSILSTKAETEQVLKTVRYEQRDTIATCQKLLIQAAELSETAMAQLEKATADLSSQAGKLNEEYGSKLKELDEYKHKLSLKMLRWIIVSQSVLIALSAALQLWLR